MEMRGLPSGWRDNLVGPGEIGRDDETEEGHDYQNAPPVRFLPRLGDAHPDEDEDHDVDQWDQHQDEPPHGLPGDTERQEKVGDRNPGEPAVRRIRLRGDGHERQRHVDVDHCNEQQKRRSKYHGDLRCHEVPSPGDRRNHTLGTIQPEFPI